MRDFLIFQDLLTPDECDKHIKKAEKDPILAEEVDLGDSRFSRVTWKNTKIGLKIWPQVKARLSELTMGSLVEGLSNRWYINKYNPGGFLYTHVDGCYTSGSRKSLYTLNIYLNEEFDGGETIFYNNSYQEVLRVKPRKGMAILFRQDVFHRGNMVSNGVKYIMRADLMTSSDKSEAQYNKNTKRIIISYNPDRK